MKSMPFALLMLLCAASPVRAVQTSEFSFTLGPGDKALGAINVSFRRVPLSPEASNLVKKAPTGLVAPRYAMFQMGPAENKVWFVAILDEAPGQDPRLIVDCNHNGDLTDDPSVVWHKVPYKAFNGQPLTRLVGEATLQVPCGDTVLPLALRFVLVDPKDPNASLMKDTLCYVPAYARYGVIKLGGESYDAILFDLEARGEFRGNVSKLFTGTSLMLDVNHNGRFTDRNDLYEVGKPFNIKGTTYVLVVTGPTGSKAEVSISKETVPELYPPPDLRVGQPAPAFTQGTIDGKTIHFPSDYKGKIVLLCVWASWCPVCDRQNPYMTQVYRAFHPRGLEVLGVSEDFPNQEPKLRDYLKARGMPWPEIYDGKMAGTPAAMIYDVTLTPTPILVDGDTGKILAGRNELLLDNLYKTVETVFTAKKR